MKNIQLSIQQHYNFSNYQMKQLNYLFVSVFSEVSKFLILGILFYGKFKVYLFSMVLLSLLRGITGGLHCKTYFSCLSFSFGYVFLALYILPSIAVSKTIMLIILLLCSLVTYCIGPVTSIYRPAPNKKIHKTCQEKVFITIFFYLLLTYLLPENHYITSGFWIIILHTLQLCVARYLKGGKKHAMDEQI